jgi:hypothetical protein
MNEFTKIPNFEQYSINKAGEIFSDKVDRLLKAQRNQRGYEFIRLHENGNQYSFLVHRLLALVFLDLTSLDSPMEVHHIDGNIYNNQLSNLEVLSSEEHLAKTHGQLKLQSNCCCGVKLSEHNSSGKCITCYNKYRVDDGITIDLIEYWVKNYSWVRASKELGLSDNGLRKRYNKLTGLNPKLIKYSPGASK